MDNLIDKEVEIKKEKPEEKELKTKLFYAVSLGLEMGFLIAIPLALFLLFGVFLDKKFHTLPVFMIVMLILSMIVTILEVHSLILPFLEKRSKKISGDKSRREQTNKNNIT
jgi:F0F1-type ATP synthase assembly protein I